MCSGRLKLRCRPEKLCSLRQRRETTSVLQTKEYAFNISQRVRNKSNGPGNQSWGISPVSILAPDVEFVKN